MTAPRLRLVQRPAEGDPGPLLPDPARPGVGWMAYPAAPPGGLEPEAWLRAVPRPLLAAAARALPSLLPALLALVAPVPLALLLAALGLAAAGLLGLHAAAAAPAWLRAASVALHGPLWDRLLALAPTAFARIPPALMAERVSAALRQGLDAAEEAAARAAEAARLAGALLVMLLVAPQAAWLALPLLLAGAAILRRLAEGALAARSRLARPAAARRRAAALLPHLPELRALGAARWAARRAGRAERAWLRAAAADRRAALARDAGLAALPALLLLLLGTALALGAAPDSTPEGRAALLLAALPAGIAAARLAAHPRRLRRGRLRALRRFLGPGAAADRPDGLPLARFETLEARGLRFTWPGASRPALADLSFSLHRGEVLALSGPSGGGKTTLVRLLLGLMPPESGEILVNGLPAAAYHPAALRRRFGAAMQDQAFGLTTIRHAVTGSLPLDEAAARAALDLAGLAAEVAALPMGLQTLLEEGSFPSALFGQLLVARALAPQPDLVILDETLGAMGPARAAALLGRLRAAGLTVVFCAHDPGLLALADRVLRLGGDPGELG